MDTPSVPIEAARSQEHLSYEAIAPLAQAALAETPLFVDKEWANDDVDRVREFLIETAPTPTPN